MKKVKYLMTLLVLFGLAMPVFAEDVACTKDIVIDSKILDTVHLIILVLQIAVPVLLVIFGMIDLIKALVAGKEDEIKKSQSIFIRRLITGVLVFFVVVIVRLVFNLAANGDKDKCTIWNCADKFINGSGSKNTCKK